MVYEVLYFATLFFFWRSHERSFGSLGHINTQIWSLFGFNSLEDVLWTGPRKFQYFLLFSTLWQCLTSSESSVFCFTLHYRTYFKTLPFYNHPFQFSLISDTKFKIFTRTRVEGFVCRPRVKGSHSLRDSHARRVGFLS